MTKNNKATVSNIFSFLTARVIGTENKLKLRMPNTMKIEALLWLSMKGSTGRNHQHVYNIVRLMIYFVPFSF